MTKMLLPFKKTIVKMLNFLFNTNYSHLYDFRCRMYKFSFCSMNKVKYKYI
jgi:hypothetical protein